VRRIGWDFWHDTEQFAEFCDWMVETGREREWKRVVAKPWHYADAWRDYSREMELERLADEEEAWLDLERRSAL
jgi:hypothetical protein